MLHRQTTSAKLHQSSDPQMCASPCTRGQQLCAVLPQHTSKTETRQAVWSSSALQLFGMPAWGLSLPRAHIIFLLLVLVRSSINNMMGWRSVPVRSYPADGSMQKKKKKKIKANNCKGQSKMSPHWDTLSWVQFATTLFCSPLRQQHGLSN